MRFAHQVAHPPQKSPTRSLRLGFLLGASRVSKSAVKNSAQDPLTTRLDGLVHGVGGQVHMAWPRHGTAVDMGLLEHDGIFQCRKHAGEMAGLKPDLADSPVRKLNLERQRRNGLDSDNVRFHKQLSQIKSVDAYKLSASPGWSACPSQINPPPQKAQPNHSGWAFCWGLVDLAFIPISIHSLLKPILHLQFDYGHLR